MIALTVIAAAHAVATAPAPSFAPPLNRPVRLSLTETRNYDGDETRYATERVITFRRRAGGYVAVVETLPSHGVPNANGSPSAESALNALAGRRVTIDLDASGNPTAVADDAALWTAVVNGIRQDMQRQSRAKADAKRHDAVIAQLRALPGGQRVAMLGGMVTPLVGLDVLAGGVRDTFPVSSTLRSPDGTTIALTGTERRFLAPDGDVVVERSLNGQDGDRRVAVTLTRRADPKTGILRASRQQTDWWTGGNHLQQVRTADTTNTR